MSMPRHSHPHLRHAMVIHYPHTAQGRVWEFFILPALIVIGLFALLRYSGLVPTSIEGISWHALFLASLFTTLRLAGAYALAIICAVPLALLATYSNWAQKILLPIFDILQSVPILAFFPILVVLFINIGFTNGAAVFILFLTMLWSLVFALIGGMGLIPREINYAAEVYGVRGFSYIRRVLLPSIFPQAVVGSILAIAQGWNIIIVAEVIRTYLPASSHAQNLFGLGSLLVSAAAQNQNNIFIAALGSSVLIIALVNFFIWQKLLKYAQRFKFEN
jgi:NitT/TauT family transport system permease protein